MKFKLLTLMLVILQPALNAQIKKASCPASTNQFGDISVALNGQGNYSGATTTGCNTNLNINLATDTVVIRAGHTRTRSQVGPINGVLIVFGTLDLQTGNNSLNINSNGQLLVYGTITGGNNTSISNNGYILIAPGADVSTGNGPQANITINGSGTAQVSGTISTPILTINGSMTIDGTVTSNQVLINGSGSAHIDGVVEAPITNNGTITGSGIVVGDITNNGTVNGVPANNYTDDTTYLGSSPTTALTWENGVWNHDAPGTGNNTGNGLAILIVDDFEIGIDTGDFGLRFSKITVKNGNTLTVGNNYLNTAKIDATNGIVAFDCTSRLSPSTTFETENPQGGKFVATQCLNWVGWHLISFPIKDNADITLGDLQIHGTNQLSYAGQSRNIYQWDATQSSWVSIPVNVNTTVGGKTFNFYAYNAGAKIMTDIAPNQFNNSSQTTQISYHAPDSLSPPGGANSWASQQTDGWVMIQNPFQDQIDWDLVAAEMDTNVFDGSAVYRWDGVSLNYTTWNTGAGDFDERYIKPYEAVFVKASSDLDTNSATFNIKNSHRRPNQSARSSVMPAVRLTVTGQGYTTSTRVIDNPQATRAFDGKYDAYFMPSMGATPKFYSVSQDSSALSLYQVPDLEDTVALGFDYGTDMRDFTISLNKDDMPSVVNVFLLDIYNNTITDLMVDDYTFTFDNNAPTERFRLFASKNGLSAEEHRLKNNESALDVKTWFNEDKLNVQLSEPLENAQIKVLNTLGQELYSQSYRQLENETISFDSKSGLHIVWVISPSNTKSVKVMRF